MADVIAADFKTRERPIEATIYLYEPPSARTILDLAHFFEQFAARSPHIAAHASAPASPQMLDPIPETAEVQPIADDQTTRVYHVRKLLAVLNDQRNKLEEQLIECMGSDLDEQAGKARAKLRENEELRLRYSTELRELTDAKPGSVTQSAARAKPKSVFVSSTYKDLVAHRSAVRQQVHAHKLQFVGMEEFGPDHLPPAMKIIQEVRNADVYIGIFGVRYGSIDPVTGISMTELELNEAEASGKPRLLYVMSDDAPVKVADIENDPAGKAKLNQLKDRILKTHVVYLFNSVDDLAHRVFVDLGKL